MSVLMNILASIGKDKWMHFTACLVLTLFVFILGCACGIKPAISAVPAFVIPIAAGVCKELVDKKKTGLLDHYDIVADFLGTFLGIVIISCLLAVLP